MNTAKSIFVNIARKPFFFSTRSMSQHHYKPKLHYAPLIEPYILTLSKSNLKVTIIPKIAKFGTVGKLIVFSVYFTRRNDPIDFLPDDSTIRKWLLLINS